MNASENAASNQGAEIVRIVADELLQEWEAKGISSDQHTAEHVARGLIRSELAGQPAPGC